MILFPGSKINLGLNVVGTRPDGYHNIESVIYPIGWTDVLEILPPMQDSVMLIQTGRRVDCPPEKNLVIKAYVAMKMRYNIGAVKMVLQKIVPDGAGLGGGSADAAATIIGLNDYFSLGLKKEEMAEIASTIGADCPFFIYNIPALATDTGTTLTPIDVPQLKGLYILVIKPATVSISTREAYAGITPREPDMFVGEISMLPVDKWSGMLRNDFETTVFNIAPEVLDLKLDMINGGAIYASMSGSGSAVYGFFPTEDLAKEVASKYSQYPSFISRI